MFIKKVHYKTKFCIKKFYKKVVLKSIIKNSVIKKLLIPTVPAPLICICAHGAMTQMGRQTPSFVTR